MSYSRWGSGSDWYIFWTGGDATCADEEVLAVWHVGDRKTLPEYSYATLKSDRELVWQDIIGRVHHANREIFDAAIDAFLKDVEAEYTVIDAVRGHAAELGIPEWLAWLEKTLGEGLPEAQARQWPLRFSQALPGDADLEAVKWPFCAFLLRRTIERVRAAAGDEGLREQVLAALDGVLTLQEQAIQTGVWDTVAAKSARLAASAGGSKWAVGSIALAAARALAGETMAPRSEEPKFVAMGARFTAETAWLAESVGSEGWLAGMAALAAAKRSAGKLVAVEAEYELSADKLVELLEAAN